MQESDTRSRFAAEARALPLPHLVRRPYNDGVTIVFFAHDAAMTRLPPLLANARSALLESAALRVPRRGMRGLFDGDRAFERISQ